MKSVHFFPSMRRISAHFLNFIKERTNSPILGRRISAHFSLFILLYMKLTLKNEPLEIQSNVKLLDTIINSQLNWNDDTNDIIEQAWVELGHTCVVSCQHGQTE